MRVPCYLAWLTIALVGCRSAAPRPAGAAILPAADRLVAGFRYSVYGPDYDPGPSYWRDVGRQMASRFPGSVPGAVWIVGRLKGQGTELSFPGRSDNPLIQFTGEDHNEETLDLFDRAGVETWLQVEPGHAPVEELIRLMLERYGHHPCVVGVGVDVEWYRSIDEPDGQAVSDVEARAWLAAARVHNPRYRLFLKHWLIEKMPPTAREGIFFIDDSQILPSLDAMVAEFAEWARAFAPAPVGFQIGYESDRPWWKQLQDPPAEIGRRLVEAVPNARGIYWVDFTVLEVFPPPASARAAPRVDPLIGVKIYERPPSLDELFAEWQALRITTAFASEALAGDAEFRRMASERGIDVFVIAPVFYNPEALARDPDLYAVTSDGAPARDDWVQFVCPSRAEYRERRVREIADLVRRLRPQGLSIDFIRHFVFWEKVHPATRHGDIPNACFCRHCVEAFAAKADVRVPDSLTDARSRAAWILAHHEAPWTDWKIGLVNSMAEEVVRAARAVDPALRINLHAVPWRRTDFGGAILRNAGQDFSALSKRVDYLSPMCYAHMLERPPDWVHSVVVNLARDSAAPVLPSIQVGEAYRPGVAFTAAEFEQQLRAALEAPSRGVVFWSWEALAKEPEKRRVVREVLASGPVAHPSGGTAVARPPGGLEIERVPLFVQFGFDDNGISGHAGSGTSGGLRFVNELFAGRLNPRGTGNPRTHDGGPARFSLYATTRYIEAAQADTPEHVKRAWRAIADAGHEIGLHSHRHAHGAAFTSEEWSAEIAECVRWLGKPFDAQRAGEPGTGVGVPRTAISGFRAPFLEHGRPLFPALRANGIAYDCSIEEGFEDHFDGRNLLWPYRIAAGYGGAPEEAQELWELPVYALFVPPDEACESYGVPKGLRDRLSRMQDYFDPAAGKITGFDWNLWVAFAMSRPEVVATFKYTLDQRLLGNRAPLTFGVHSDIYSEQYPTTLPTTAEERRQALREILEYALGRPEVRVVSARQLLDWLRDPSPLF